MACLLQCKEIISGIKEQRKELYKELRNTRDVRRDGKEYILTNSLYHQLLSLQRKACAYPFPHIANY